MSTSPFQLAERVVHFPVAVANLNVADGRRRAGDWLLDANTVLKDGHLGAFRNATQTLLTTIGI